MPTAFLFPGQGSFYAGMGKDLYDKSAAAKEVFSRVDQALGRSLSGICFSGDADTLALTKNQQPAVLTVSLASLACFNEQSDGPKPDFAAGHSLGEYSALVMAGAIELEDAARIVELRGKLMQEAVPVGEGKMAAVLGLDAETIEQVCSELQEKGEKVWVANYNGGGQIVISGLNAGLNQAESELKKRGAKRLIPLKVSAPFHTPLMKPAADRLAEALAGINWRKPEIPVVANVDAKPYSAGESLPDKLTRQVVSPVQWEKSVRYLISRGVNRTIEFAPGKVLTGLVRRIDSTIQADISSD